MQCPVKNASRSSIQICTTIGVAISVCDAHEHISVDWMKFLFTCLPGLNKCETLMNYSKV